MTDAQKIAGGILGAVITGFAIGAGFILAKKVFDRKPKVATTPTPESMSNASGGWGNDNWINAEQARMMDSTNGLNGVRSRYYGADGDNKDYEVASSMKNFDWATGQHY
jgi:hypothetical protein